MSPQVIQPTAKPVPFFPRTAHRVADYYKGNIFQVSPTSKIVELGSGLLYYKYSSGLLYIRQPYL